MALDAASQQWLTLVLSSALVSALVAGVFNTGMKLLEWRRENKKEEQGRGHDLLSIALQLEGFVEHCSATLYDIDRYLRDLPSETVITQPNSVQLRFDLEPQGNALPLEIVAELKELFRQFEATGKWIGDQYEAWADIEDAYGLEKQRLSHFGMQAFRMSKTIRHRLAIAVPPEVTALVAQFTDAKERSRISFLERPDDVTVIPVWQTQFATRTKRWSIGYGNPSPILRRWIGR